MTCHTFDAYAAICIDINYRTILFTTVFWWPIMEECIFKQTYYMKCIQKFLISLLGPSTGTSTAFYY